MVPRCTTWMSSPDSTTAHIRLCVPPRLLSTVYLEQKRRQCDREMGSEWLEDDASTRFCVFD
jgi:hypothetical protein